MKKRSILLGCVTMLAVASVMGSGCNQKGAQQESSSVSTEQTASAEESQESVSDTAAEEDTDASQESVDGEQESAAETVEEPDFSAGLTDDGLFADYTASDYVELGTYKGVKVPKEEAAVSDEDFQTYLDNLMADYIETVTVTDRAAKTGDTVNIDYVGSVDGVEFEGGAAEGFDLELGSGRFIPGFEDQLVDHEPGEEFDITVTFPESYPSNTDLEGKEAVFHIVLNGITEEVTPEIDDAFVEKNFSDEASSADEFLTKKREEQDRSQLKTYAWDKVLEESEVKEIPEPLIENYVEQQIKMYKYMASAYGMSYADFLSYYGVTEEEFEKSEREYANTDLTRMLVAQAICEKEGIQAEDGDAEKIFGYDTDRMKEIYEEYGKGYVHQVLLMEKVADLIADESVIE